MLPGLLLETSMAAPLPPTAHRALHVLRFIDVLEDDDPTKLSWTKIGVAISTVFTTVTGFAAMIQSSTDSLAHANWTVFGYAIGLHTVAKGAHEIKRWTETPDDPDAPRT